MALVNLLQFGPDTGAIISDEEFWNIFFRKRLYADNLHLLLDEDLARNWRMEVVYGGVGYPSLHHEVVRDTRRALRQMYSSAVIDKEPPALVKEVARMAFEQLQLAIRRRIDQKLLFSFGFANDDLNRGYFFESGSKVEISNKKIRDSAVAMASGDKADALLKATMASKAAVFGFDETYGITSYHLSIENWVMGYIHEGFEAIGTGKYASGLVLGQDFNSKVFKARKAGYGIGEGILELFESAIVAFDHFKEVGGNFNLMILDRKGAGRAQQVREIADHRARLLTEIVRAHKFELLTKEAAIRLIEELALTEVPWLEMERRFFDAVADKEKLHFMLRRYKLDEIGEIAQELTAQQRQALCLSKGGEQS